MRRRRKERSQRAVAAALALARENGLRFEGPSVLNDLFSLMVHLPFYRRVAETADR